MEKVLNVAGGILAGVMLGLVASGCAVIAGETIARGYKIVSNACKKGEK